METVLLALAISQQLKAMCTQKGTSSSALNEYKRGSQSPEPEREYIREQLTRDKRG